MAVFGDFIDMHLVYYSAILECLIVLEYLLFVKDLDELAAPITRKFKNPRFFFSFIKVVEEVSLYMSKKPKYTHF